MNANFSRLMLLDQTDSARHPSNKLWVHTFRKRAFDLSVAVPALLCSLPVLGAVAILIKTTSSGPAFFRQKRVGKNQKLFTIYKFRTMHQFAEQEGPSVTRRGDPRVTRVGSMLRRLKLDELPQLYNVVLGEMSLVGPRPKLEQHEQMQMHCRPGITGAATVVFSHEDEMLARIPEEFIEHYTTSFLNPLKATLDQQYADEGTFSSDLSILFRTLLKLSRSKRSISFPELAEVSFDLDIPEAWDGMTSSQEGKQWGTEISQ